MTAQRSIFFTLILFMSGLPAYGKTYKPLYLVELFTSQGCSSCPPAEKWLNSLANHPGQFNQFVTIAFHVDYWDYLGWKDTFSQEKFSQRQRRYRQENQFQSVATPTIAVNGVPYFRWRKNEMPKLSKIKLPGMQIVREKSEIKITWKTNIKGDLKVWYAPLSGHKKIKISKGENAGRTLRHHHSALALYEQKMSYDKKNQQYVAKLAINDKLVGNAAGFAAWISSTKTQKPIVATGGKLR